MRAALLVMALGLLTAGCGSSGPPSFRGDPFAPASARSLVVFIENNTLDDVRVEARSPGDRHDLGTVNARTRRQTSVPWSALAELRFQIDPLTGQRATTRGVSVGPGEQVTLVIVEPIEQSFIRP